MAKTQHQTHQAAIENNATKTQHRRGIAGIALASLLAIALAPAGAFAAISSTDANTPAAPAPQGVVEPSENSTVVDMWGNPIDMDELGSDMTWDAFMERIMQARSEAKELADAQKAAEEQQAAKAAQQAYQEAQQAQNPWEGAEAAQEQQASPATDPAAAGLADPIAGELVDPVTGEPIDPAANPEANPEANATLEPEAPAALDPATAQRSYELSLPTQADSGVMESIEAVDYMVNPEIGIEAVTLEGKAATSKYLARAALMSVPELETANVGALTATLFTLGESDDEGDTSDDDTSDATLPRSGDGSNIEFIHAIWLTPDTVDNGDAAKLYLRPQGDADISVRLQISYALSGEHNYAPGDVTITVPAYLYTNRAGKNYGSMAIPFLEEPSTKGDFNWKLTTNDAGEPVYVLTNTKRMSAATKGYIQFAIEDLAPYELVDMAESDAFDAYIEVVTHLGNTIALRSNELTMQVDTEARLIDASKAVYGAPSFVPASSVPASLRIEGEEEYVKVEWYAWGAVSSNTYYTVNWKDSVPQDAVVYTGSDGTVMTEADAKGILLNATSADGTSITGSTDSPIHANGRSAYSYYSVVYPASQFLPDTTYTFHNNVTYTLTELDPATDNTNPNVNDGATDPKLVTTDSATATTTFRYSEPKWENPEGHFMVCKNGNDDTTQHGKATGNLTHKRYEADGVSDEHIWYRRDPIDLWYGVYPSALNDLQDMRETEGDDGLLRLSYTIDSVGYVMPWTYEPVHEGTPRYDEDGNLVYNEEGKLLWEIPASRIKDNYFRDPVTITSTDTGVRIGQYSDYLTVLDDYIFVAVEIPEAPWIYSGEPHNIDDTGSWTAKHAADGTFLYTRDSDVTHVPDVVIDICRNGEWETYATASWSTGSMVVTLADGSTQTSKVISLPADTENIRSSVTVGGEYAEGKDYGIAAIDYDIRPVIALKSTESLLELVNSAFEQSNIPELQIWNGVDMIATEADSEGNEKLIVEIPKEGYDAVRGYTTDVTVYPHKNGTWKQSEVDYGERTVTVHYSASVEERSVINDRQTYEQALADGRLTPETHGIWRDLLPKGMAPKLDTVTLRSGDTITDIYIVANYKGTGRTLLVVEADLTPSPVRYSSGDMYYYEDTPSIKFDAVYDFESMIDYGDTVHNVIAFESSNDQLGTIDKYTGEPDDPTAGNNVSSPLAFAKDEATKAEEIAAMTGLNPDRENANSFVYAGVQNRLDILSAARTSLSKDVQVNLDGRWSSGVYDSYSEQEAEERIVYEGGTYSYRLRMMSNTGTITRNMVLFDSLENFVAADGNSPIDVEDELARWQGELVGIDTSQLESMGCAPVVYYSTIANLQLADESNIHEANELNVDITNTSVWTPASEYTGSLADVKAIAIDATTRADGTDFQLEPLESATVLVNMKAPDGEEARTAIADNAHAYNNVFLTCESIDEESGVANDEKFVRKDYTKVGIAEYKYTVTKVWSDDNNRDGKRPASVTVNLMRNGVATGDSLEVTPDANGVWTAEFGHLPYCDPEGVPYRYSATEDAVDEYAAKVTPNGTQASIITNTHEPERISVQGEKTWEGDEDVADTARPESILITLYGNGAKKGAQTVRPAADGTWSWSFDNMYKYENGREITYTITEEIASVKGKSYDTQVDGLDVMNTYEPYGDLLVTKTLQDATSVSEQQDFTFTFEFTRPATDGGDPVPVFNEYEYEVLDESGAQVSTGTLTTSSSVTIKGGQSIRVIDVDEYVDYEVTEAEVEGFTQTSAEGATGTIAPRETAEATFVNTYHATGQMSLGVEKTLYNHELKRYQFDFALYKVEDSGEQTLVRQASNGTATNVQTNDDGQVTSAQAKATFGTVRFTQADAGQTYTYVVKEVDAGKGGYTSDATEYYVTAAIEDNGDGTMTVTTQTYKGSVAEGNEVDAMAFENTYEATGTLELQAWKELPGRALAAGDFTFELLDEDDNPLLDSEGNPITATNDATGAITFPALSYTHEDVGKTFTYKAREVAGTDDTVEYDTNVWVFTVAVADNGDGTLEFAQGTQQLVETVLPNTFHMVQLARGAVPAAYASVLSSTDFNEASRSPQWIVLSNTEGTDGKAFMELASTSAGYSKHEAGADETDAEFEAEAIAMMEAKASRADDGSLVANKLYGVTVGARVWFAYVQGGDVVYEVQGENEAPTFANALKPGSLAIAKKVVNAESASSDTEFTFDVKLIGSGLADGTVSYVVETAGSNEAETKTATVADGEFTVVLKANQTAHIVNLAANTAYQVREQSLSGWVLQSSDAASGTIIPLDTSTATFTNQYAPGSTSVQLDAIKLLDGEPAAEGAFSFKLMDADGNVLETVTNSAGGLVQFTPIVYGSEGAGTYTYTIVEVEGDETTIAYDSTAITATVTVKDDGEGSMTATVAYDGDRRTFENATKPGRLEVSKTVVGGSAANATDTFGVKVTLTSANGKPLTDEVTWYVGDESAANTATGGVVQATLAAGETLVLPELPAGTTYRVEETTMPTGWQQTNATNATGTIVSAQTSAATIENTYSAEGEVQLVAHKALEGATLEEGQFAFELLDADGTVIDEAVNDAVDESEQVADETTDEGTLIDNPWKGTAPVTFHRLTFTQDDIGKTYTYTIREKTATDGVYVYDSHDETVTVTVEDAGKGNLTVTASYDEDGALFTNEMGTATLKVTKNVVDAPDDDASAFEFTLNVTDANGTAAAGPFELTLSPSDATAGATNLENGGSFSITAAQTATIAGLPHGSTYALTETDQDNWTLTSSTGATATVKAGSTYEAAFTNTYEETPYSASGTVSIVATKTITGGVITEGDEFAFQLLDDGGTVLQTKPCDSFGEATSTVTFDDIAYGLEDAGQTFVYQVREVRGSDENVKYDSTIYEVRVDVEDGGNGTLLTRTTMVKPADGGEQQVDAIQFTNARQKATIAGTKEWDDGDDADGLRPDSITVNLLRGSTVIKSAEVTPDANGVWSFEFTDLPVYSGGREISYSVIESAPPSGYSSQGGTKDTGYTITNTHEPATTSMSITKVWSDAGNQDGKRPTAAQFAAMVELLANDEAVADVAPTVVDNGDNTYTVTWADLPANSGGTAIAYQAREIASELPEGYEPSTEEAVDAGATITNTYTPEVISIPVTKTWDDANNQDNLRPESVSVQLLAGGEPVETATVTPDANGAWAYEFAGLPRYASGSEIAYTVQELNVPEGYEATVSGSAAEGFTITNAHEPNTTQVKVTKSWQDGNNQDGLRPQSIKVQLYANNVAYGQPVRLNATGTWTYTFEDLPENANGTPIAYTVREVSVPTGYEAEVSGSASGGYTITNTHTPATISVSGTKTWDDANNQDGKRPASITVNLLADGAKLKSATVTPDAEGVWAYEFADLPQYAGGNEIAYTVTEDAVDNYSTLVDGFDITNSYTPGKTSLTVAKSWNDGNDRDGLRPATVSVQLYANGTVQGSPVELSADEGWTYTWSGLDQMAGGSAIAYTVQEVETPEGYAAEVTGNATEGFTITNTHEPETTSIAVTKVWDDEDDQDGIRPEGASVQLYAAGEALGDPVILPQGGSWTYTWSDLPVNAGGTAIAYTVQEVSVPAGYEAAITGSAAEGFTITNTHEPETTSIAVTKVWDDGDDQDGLRPASVSAQLYADDVALGDPVSLSGSDWAYTWSDLPVCADGTPITYSVEEVEVPEGYEAMVTGSVDAGFTITNTHEPETTTVSGKKVWADDNDRDGLRPASAVIELLANGTKVDSATVTAANGWAFEFTNLPANKAGSEIAYTVQEANVPAGYTATTMLGNVVNTHVPETIDIAGTKTWADDDNRDGLRPESITVNLLANGAKVDSATVTAAEGWAYSFTGLPAYENGAQIAYAVTEDAVANYSPQVSGFDIENPYTPGKTSVTVSKTWNDNNNADGLRPASISVQLYANGAAQGEPVVLNVSNGYTYTYTNLPMKSGGTAIAYTVEESVVPEGYTSEVTGSATGGFVITNTHESATTQVAVTKTWADEDNINGERPDSITVNLLANGAKVDSATVTAEDGWAHTFADLPKYADGKEIAYTATEDAVANYTTQVDGFAITNTYEPQTTSVTIAKVWDDGDNADKIRPASVTVQLYANGAAYGKPIAVNKSGSWTYTATNLPATIDGVAVDYTVEEVDVPKGYTATIAGSAEEGFTITNAHEPSTPSTPTPPKPAVPTTGDATPVGLVIGIAAVAAVVVALAVVAKRRLKK